jgi:pimeloyl-ACP methyl ester carboxylesterase
MPHLDADGVAIYYEVHGNGPTVLLSHGYSASSAMWADQVAALEDRYQVIVWDMRGHGQSDYPADPAVYSQALTVADMVRLLDAAGAERAVIGGLSLGGYMSLAFHLAEPERVAALMLFDTGPGFKKDAAREAWNERSRKRADDLERDGFAALGISAEVSASQHRSADGLAHAARGMLAQRDASVIESLPEIQVPTLVLAGADDTPFLAATDYMAAKIPGATKVMVDGAGHAANLDQPAAFNAAVEAFLDRVGGARSG